MMKNLLIFIIIICTSCTPKQTECIEISNKYGDNGSYYFEWINGFGNNEIIPNVGMVSEGIFNQYKVGDIYCIDELML
tara:strand:- start:7009 stop:7242 length:234 start_codon:yes stop_codon:yes gene_type:complete